MAHRWTPSKEPHRHAYFRKAAEDELRICGHLLEEMDIALDFLERGLRDLDGVVRRADSASIALTTLPESHQLMPIRSLLRGALLMGTLLLAVAGRGQGDLELATYYYNTGAFEQARLYLDNLYKKDPSTYEMYLNTLLELEDFDEAEKVVKSRLKKRKDKSMANVDLGSLYLRIGREAECTDRIQRGPLHLAQGRGPAKRLAEAFIKLDQLDLALATYEKAIRRARTTTATTTSWPTSKA